MEELVQSYLSFLASMSRSVEELGALADRQLEAAKTDDLQTLNELMNQEQALALTFRGLEQTRDRLLSQLGMEGLSLSQTPSRVPAQWRKPVEEAVAVLQGSYQTYRQKSKKARAFLEQNMREVDAMVAQMGGPPPEMGPGYGKPAQSGPPPSMKTDFRA